MAQAVILLTDGDGDDDPVDLKIKFRPKLDVVPGGVQGTPAQMLAMQVMRVLTEQLGQLQSGPTLVSGDIDDEGEVVGDEAVAEQPSEG